MKTCLGCKEEKSREEFYMMGKYRASRCKKCYNKRALAARALYSTEQRDTHDRNQNIVKKCPTCHKKFHPRYSAKKPTYCSFPCYTQRNKGKTCLVEGCEGPFQYQGYCSTHNYRLKKFGDPTHPLVHGKRETIKQREMEWENMQGPAFTPWINGKGDISLPIGRGRAWLIFRMYFSQQLQANGQYYSLANIGGKFGISRERVRQIKETGLWRLSQRNRVRRHFNTKTITPEKVDV